MKVQCSCADHRVDQERGILKLKPNSPNVKLMVSENGKEFFEKE
jgi:hypothetical protein